MIAFGDVTLFWTMFFSFIENCFYRIFPTDQTVMEWFSAPAEALLPALDPAGVRLSLRTHQRLGLLQVVVKSEDYYEPLSLQESFFLKNLTPHCCGTYISNVLLIDIAIIHISLNSPGAVHGFPKLNVLCTFSHIFYGFSSSCIHFSSAQFSSTVLSSTNVSAFVMFPGLIWLLIISFFIAYVPSAQVSCGKAQFIKQLVQRSVFCSVLNRRAHCSYFPILVSFLIFDVLYGTRVLHHRCFFWLE